MSNSNSELHARIKAIDAKIDQFERQASIILGFTLAIAVTSYLILIEVLCYGP